MIKTASTTAAINALKLIEKLRKQHLLNIKEGKSFTIEEARMYSKNKIAQLSKV